MNERSFGTQNSASHVFNISCARRPKKLSDAPEAQPAELDYRIARHEQNPSDAIPGAQVKAVP